METAIVRLGGALGIISAVAMLPRAIIATFTTPAAQASAHNYFAASSAFATPGALAPVLHILCGLAFLGTLVALLRAASGPTAGVYTALAGGVVFFALTAGGFAAEVAFPIARVQFGDAPIELNEPLEVLATWLYHFCQIGAAAMIFATSSIIWRTAVLPKWTAAGALLGVLALLSALIPLPGALPTLTWILMIGLVMVFAPGAVTRPPRPADATTAEKVN